MTRLTCIPLLLLLAVTGCATPGGGYYQDDGPHARPPANLDRIPDAVPRAEAPSRGGNRPYEVFGVRYTPVKTVAGYRERGVASWYGKKFHGRLTSNGETYDMYSMTAAHKTLPLPSYVRVRNLNNGKSVIVRVNDRGPFKHNRLIDLSYAAAHRLDILRTGTGVVEVEGLTGDSPAPAVTAQAPAHEPLPAPLALAPTAHAAPAAPRLFLQVGAFASRDNAENLKQRLTRADFAPVQIQGAQLDSATLYRVRIGPMVSVDAADRLAARVQAHGLPNPVVVVEP